MRRCLASTGVWSLRTKVRHCEPQSGSPTSPGPMLTTEICVSVVRTNRGKWLRHLDQKGKVAGVRVPVPKPRCPQDHPACSRQLKVRSSLALELGNSTRSSLHPDTNPACRRENASGRCGRRRRRSSQRRSCNGISRAKVRQGNNHDATDRMAKGMPAVASKEGPTDHTGKADLSGAMSCGPLVRPWDMTMSGLLPRSSVVVTWKAGCGESRTSGLEWGKDREVLPITTSQSFMLLEIKRPHPPVAGWVSLRVGDGFRRLSCARSPQRHQPG